MRRFKVPSSARREGVSGTATVRFTLTANGELTRVNVAGSSGSPAIDDAAVDAVRNAAPFPAFPAGGPSSKSFIVPMVASVR